MLVRVFSSTGWEREWVTPFAFYGGRLRRSRTPSLQEFGVWGVSDFYWEWEKPGTGPQASKSWPNGFRKRNGRSQQVFSIAAQRLARFWPPRSLCGWFSIMAGGPPLWWWAQAV